MGDRFPASLHKISTRLESELINPMLSYLSKRRVVLFHIGRSGSTVLGDLLNQHSEIGWDGEVYEKLFRSLNISSVTSGHDQLSADPVKLIRKRIRNSGRKYYGFEVKFFHLRILDISLEDYIERLSRLGFTRFVVLKRRNYLRKIVSSLIAHERNQYFLQDAAQVKLHQVYVDVDQIRIDRDQKSLISFLQTYEQHFKALDHLLESKQTLHLVYEDDILPDPLLGYRRVCDFLNVDHQEVHINFVRTNPFKLSELVTNFADVERVLSGTTFEWMLYD